MLKQDHQKSVLLGMSGGVDSSVAALLLKKQGYTVKGVALKLWAYNAENPCCSTEDLHDARTIAQQLGIDFEVIDMQEAFRQSVVGYYLQELSEGRTPNPCIVCNDLLKFGLLMDYALKNNYDYVATGHYARIRADENGFHLIKALDHSKDQSYFLFMLDQTRLSRILFPLGDLDKNTVRDIARDAELITCEKEDSQELCFLPSGGFKEFSSTYTNIALREGKIIDRAGTTIGTHKGLQFYTIGQRKGIGVYTNEPVYVIKKNVADNSIMVDTGDGLMSDTCTVRDVHWIARKELDFPCYANVRIRYRHTEKRAFVNKKDTMIMIKFDSPQRAITPGQAAVFYHDEEILGGGWIEEAKR
jgi:tRNA-specific 2-thiouridylase